jgi:hypothetical protein
MGAASVDLNKSEEQVDGSRVGLHHHRTPARFGGSSLGVKDYMGRSPPLSMRYPKELDVRCADRDTSGARVTSTASRRLPLAQGESSDDHGTAE